MDEPHNLPTTLAELIIYGQSKTLMDIDIQLYAKMEGKSIFC